MTLRAMTKKILTALIICAGVSASAWAAPMSDAEFLELCASGSIPRLQIAIENGANVNAKDQNGMTALMRAARDNFHPVVLQTLLGAGADPNPRDKDGKRAVDYARENKRSRDAFGLTQLEVASGERGDLLRACYGGTAENVRAALAAGADANSATDDGMTALMWAAYANASLDIMKALLEAGANVNAKDRDGETALMQAAFYNSSESVELLLDAGADPDARDRNNLRAIEYLRWRRSMHGTNAHKRLEAITKETELKR